MAVSPRLLCRRRRRPLRRLVFLSALVGLFLFAPTAVATPPEISVTISGTLGLNGWYRSNVTVNWQVEGEISSTGCDTRTLSADTPGTRITCMAESADGDQTSKTITIKLDKTPPLAAALPERAADANGWYNRPLTVWSSGTDATSGMGSCSSAQYTGPDTLVAAVVGSCPDLAGNVTTTSYQFKYDATAPTITALSMKRGNRSAQIAWRKSNDTQVVEVQRAPGRNGQGETMIFRGSSTGFRDTGLVVGRKYEYRVIGVDEALNRAEQKVNLVATGALLSPAPAERVTAPPNLVWTAVKRASYYNVQLIRGRTVLSAWPARPSLQLRRTWLYKGRRYRLRPGVYRWYVWPGYGRISAARYGRLLGSSTFVVPG
jgi:hypothetical protein